MKCLTRILLALSLLAIGSTANASVVVDGNAGLQLSFLETSDGTWAFVRVQARYHLPLAGSLTIRRNGEILKVDPIETVDQMLVTAFLGPNGKEYAVCAQLDAETFLGGDNYRPANVKACGFRTSAPPGVRAPQFGSRLPRLAATRGGALSLSDL